MRQDTINEAIRIINRQNIPTWLKEAAIEVLGKYGQHIRESSWTSGCCTEVAPIMFWQGYMEVQLNTRDKRYFPQKSLNTIVREYPQFKRVYFSKTDGSCPDTLVFHYKEPLR